MDIWEILHEIFAIRLEGLLRSRKPTSESQFGDDQIWDHFKSLRLVIVSGFNVMEPNTHQENA